MTLDLLVLTTSYPLEVESTSGIFVARLVQHYPADVRAVVLTPSDTRLRAVSPGGTEAAVRMFRYAPRRLQVLAHDPGGIPAALKRNRWAYLLVPLFLLSMFLHIIWRARAAQLIHANWAICGLIAGLAGRFLGKPVITTLRGEDVMRTRRAGLDRLILFGCLKLSNRVVAVSEEIRSWIRSTFPSCADRISLIENGVEPAFFEAGESRIINAGQCFRLLYIGSLIPRKNVDLILQAIEKLDRGVDVRLTIVGDGAERPRLEALAHRLGIAQKVRFTGQIAPDGIPDLLVEADAFILASRSEGRPNVVLEAMASGLPVIATDIPGVGELVVTHETGLLFPVGGIDRLAACIQMLASNPALSRALGANARRFMIERGLTWDNAARNYHRLFIELINPEKCT
ncbi:MAG: glycosyltransferase family 4 protein [Rhodocyclaceae bacterium]|nr:glycosyltransferase family 4 protein [Rhodocyclaceae bacterium]